MYFYSYWMKYNTFRFHTGLICAYDEFTKKHEPLIHHTRSSVMHSTLYFLPIYATLGSGLTETASCSNSSIDYFIRFEIDDRE